MLFLGHRQVTRRERTAEFALGNHPVADRLRDLTVSLKLLMVLNHVETRMILPVGTPVGTPVGPALDHASYFGVDRSPSRLTVDYPNVGPRRPVHRADRLPAFRGPVGGPGGHG
ncbi:hypothetical protein [Rhodococcus sp. SJ]|uniref:hypothetical protein n=1 Tax=Rhodococcus sp. SJ TaxID=3434112 RepID=UPI003D7AD157